MIQAEATFRQQTIAQGLVLLGDEAQVVSTLKTRLVLEAPTFRRAVTGDPFDPSLFPLVQAVVDDAFDEALTMTEGDYMIEIDTVAESLEQILAENGVGY